MTALRSVPLPDQHDARLARMDERRGRLAAIEAMPEAEGKTMLVKCGLALRFDLPLMRVRSFLIDAPATDDPDAVFEWLEAIRTKPNLRFVK